MTNAKDGQRTLVTFLLDRTQSMGIIKESTIEAFNGYVDGLQNGDGAGLVDFTLIQFDTISIDKLCVGVPVAKAVKLNNDNYQPRGATPLIDAAYKTIKAVEASLNGKQPKIVICIQTDGEENSSREHTWDELQDLIKEKTTLGWQFNFMGAGIDAYKRGHRMGIAASATVSYDHLSPHATRAVFGAQAMNTSSFASGARMYTLYSASQKSLAGDRFDPNRGISGSAKVVQPQTVTAKSAVKKAVVEDFSLK